MEKLKALIYGEEGASAVEYALLVAGIAVAIAAAVFTLGTTITTMFTGINTQLGGS
jgi:pilus assembly protein Flp/PilA